MKTIFRRLVTVACVICLCQGLSMATFGQDYSLASSNMVAGGGQVSGGAFDLISSIGQIDAGESSGGPFTLSGGFLASDNEDPILLGDINLDGAVNLLDVAPFVELVASGSYQAEADINGDLEVNLLDVAPFVELLAG